MKDIYVMAAPSDIPVDVLTPEQAAAMWKNDEIQKVATLILFKDIHHVSESFRAGLAIDNLQIGGLPAGPGRELVYKTIALDEADRRRLDELLGVGVNVFFQMLPEETPHPYKPLK
jgi:D-glucosaminate-specific PTS system IIB component